MPTPAKGQIGLVLENPNSPGEQPLLPATSIAASMSLTNQPTGSTGMRLLIWIYGHTASGTITIAGKDINNNSQTEGPINVPVPPAGAQSAFVAKWEYETNDIFGSVNASGITTTGLTNGTIVILGIQAPKYMIAATLKSKAKYDVYRPNEHRSTFDKNTKSIQLVKKVALDELKTALYPRESVWVGYCAFGTLPTITTLPASPTSLLAATAVAASMSLTTQPTAPGMGLILTVASSTATGTVGIAGIDPLGNAQSETINANAGGSNGNGTYYSTKIYKSVNASGITTTGLTTGTLAVTGVYGWQYVWQPGDALYTAGLEKWTGVDTFSMPWTYFDEWTFELAAEKELMVTSKGLAQDRTVIGDRTVTTLATSRAASLGSPTDLPLAGWQTLVYLDTLAGNIPTTPFADMEELKMVFKNPATPRWTLTNTQNYNRLNRAKREVELDCKLDLTNVLQLEQYRQFGLQYLTFQFIGPSIGGGFNEQWQFSFPVRYDDFDMESMPEGTNVPATVKLTPELDTVGLGSSYKVTVITQMPPVYPN
jgi:hypothetical protein